MNKNLTPCFFLVLTIFQLTNLLAQNWTNPLLVETISDSYGVDGEYSSLQIINGNPAISYFDETNGYLKYIRAIDSLGETWSIPVSIEYIAGYNGTLCTSLQFVNGYPAIAFYSANSGDLKYVRALDSIGLNWGTPVSIDVSGNVGEHASLLVVNGNPAIAYYYNSGGDLKYIRATDAYGSSWAAPISVDITGDVGKSASLQIINGAPAISYQNSLMNNSHLKYVRSLDSNGTLWGTPVFVDASSGVGDYNTSLQEVNGKPAISYYDTPNGNLKYVISLDSVGVAWSSPEAIDVSGNVGAFSSLQVIDGKPAVSYQTITGGHLKYIRAIDSYGAVWGSPIIIDISNGVGYYTSLQLINSKPAISYYDILNGDLKYIRATDWSGVIWGSPNVIDGTGNVGLYLSLKLINGLPAFSYYDSHNKNLKYRNALDPSGTTWAPPIVIDDIGNVGMYSSLERINGTPAISYFDKTNGNLKFIHASDSSGSHWNPAISINESIYAESYNSLKVVGGKPAISYYDDWTGILKYVRAIDSAETNWSTPQILPGQTSGTSGKYNSLQVVNGNPAISYYDGSLKFVRANDSLGVSWANPITVDGVAGVGSHTSLQIVAGFPAISYYDGVNGNLKYVRALNASGTLWGTPTILDAVGTVGQYTSLQIVDGNPAITYYDLTNKDLKYIRANDTFGTSWSSPISLVTTGDVGQYASMVSIGIGAGIVYYNLSMAVPYYISGSTSTEVWPGDANHDYSVNNYDLLPLGLYYSQMGSARAIVSNSWQGYSAFDWGAFQNNGQNYKYADCNGDGIININDTLAIFQNFSFLHALSTTNNDVDIERNSPNLYFVFPDSNYNAGDFIQIDVMMGDSLQPFTNLYGIAFNVKFNGSLIQPGTEKFVYIDNWLGVIDSNAIKIERIDTLNSIVYTAKTRIDHKNANGFGKIAEFSFQLVDSIVPNTTLNLSLLNPLATDSAGVPILLSTSTDSLIIRSTPSMPEIINGEGVICIGSTNTYSINPVNGAMSYTWVLPDGWLGNSTTTSISATAGAASGNIMVFANNINGASPPQLFNVIVNSLPDAPSISEINGILISSVSNSNQWYLDGNIINGAVLQYYSPSENGNYTIIATDSNGCSSVSQEFIFSSIGIAEFNGTSLISISPNPVVTQTTITFAHEPQSVTIEIVNLLGQTCKKISVVSKKNIIERDDLQSGVYIIQVKQNGEIVAKEKIVVH